MSKATANRKERRTRPPVTADQTATACREFRARLTQALEIFRTEDEPLWKRTQDGMRTFAGQDMDHLPARLLREIDRRFVAINKILARYPIKTWEDYAMIPEEDLLQMQRTIEAFLSHA